MKTKKVTYEDYEKLSGTSDLYLNQLLDLFGSMNWKEGTFLYFEINNINVLQLSYENDNRFLIEITNDGDEMIYLQKYATYEEAVELIEYYFENEEIGSTIGFYEVPINTKTLDDILEENK
ncbi:hypothetical protein [Pedobacter sp. AJM]|uniref:hypothetical protein n=1 Tax=Pedobacter sp. AJM TaxID=2003629 RepID=UPI000B4B3D09|nr:hypothetical protein [Pedobacter sp. AJM]OWK70938.1 hypothetical protein CBW18_07570 [Pedobacter sp. AJM]